MNLRDFVTKHVDADERQAQAADSWPFGDGYYFANQHIAYHYARHNPDRVLRQVTADRAVIDRHHTTDDPRFTQYCHGCPGDADSFPCEEIEDCPELQGIAWRWHDDPEWSIKWCPHYETVTGPNPRPPDPWFPPGMKQPDIITCRFCDVRIGMVTYPRTEDT